MSGNTLKLTLNKFDMTDMGIKYETLSKKSEQTRNLLTRVLDAVKLNASVDCNVRFDFTGERLFVEAFPRPDGGCMMYISCITGKLDTCGGGEDMTFCRLPAASHSLLSRSLSQDEADDTIEYNSDTALRKTRKRVVKSSDAPLPSSFAPGSGDVHMSTPTSPSPPVRSTRKTEQITLITQSLRGITGAQKRLDALSLCDGTDTDTAPHAYYDERGDYRLVFATRYSDEVVHALCEFGEVVRGGCEAARTREYCRPLTPVAAK